MVQPEEPENEPSLASEERRPSLFGTDDFVMDIEDHDDDDYDDDDSWNDEHLCIVCFCSLKLSTKTSISCPVCLEKICSECMQLHLRAKIMEGFVLLKCPGDLCTRVLTDDEVGMYCKELWTLYIKNKVDAENDPKRKTCPGCNIVHNFDGLDEIPLHHKCSFCGLQWCVPCHAPWHIGMTCKMYNKDVVGKGRKALKVWAKGKGKDSANAKKCPKCHFFIERISGCDHMVCTKCSTDFCYKCGKKHRSAGILGDHYSRYSFLGCKYNLLPNKPAARIAVRSGAVFGTFIFVSIAAVSLASVGCIALAVSPIGIPVYVLVKKCRK